MSNSSNTHAMSHDELFDAEWYLQQNPDVAQAGVDPFEHYMTHGWREGRDPHPLFDTSFYLENNPDIAEAGENPLVHYCLFGWREGRNPHSGFYTSWYLEKYPDVASAGENPLRHYVEFGQFEGRKTAPDQADIPQRSEHISYSTFTPRLQGTSPANRPVKIIAFYLPQFHPIPENDEWWGKGFTEWTNVKPAGPQFAGHYQPHVPIELGYYDLRDKAAQCKQIELAKLYGIEGFCFYFYWFGGKRLLETPIENWLNDKSLDLPFCLCWANENWSRRWDGLDSEVLIAQNHSDEDDTAFIREVARYMRDPRYIRINGRPLLLVYRPNLLPTPRETVARWRAWCRQNGIGEIYLSYVQSFERTDPFIYDFDAAVEFPPNNFQPPKLNSSLIPLREDFAATVYDWRAYVEASEAYPAREYNLFRSVCPGWDNTARRKNKGTIFVNNTPQLYRRWLENAIRDTIEHFENPDERLIFVNAWNEWAEGAHLEPDEQTGYAYLQATRDALTRGGGPFLERPRALVVAHDAHPHGAQFLSLNLARSLRDEFGYLVDLISLGEGALLERFSEVATLHQVDIKNDPQAVTSLVRSLRDQGADFAIVNTTVSGSIIPALKQAGVAVVSLVHEMPGILSAYSLENPARAIANQADTVVFAAAPVQAGFESFVGKKLSAAKIRPQGLYLRNPYRSDEARKEIRTQVRQELGLPADARLVLAVGYADHRKGVDLFMEMMSMVAASDPSAYGVWIGHRDEELFNRHWKEIINAELEGRFRFTGLTDHPQRYYSAADVYALTSREDPFPSVVMEALDAGLPIVGFEGCTGTEDIIKRGGMLVPAFDTCAFAKAVGHLLNDADLRNRHANQGQAIVERELNFRHYLFDLLAFAGKRLPRVSVIVPNYNYASYLRARLNSIAAQTATIYELIILDDASTDGSVQVIQDFLADNNIPSTLVVNEKNSGSVFSQWLRGVELARGDLVWIAEADDLADPDFLANVTAAFATPGTVMSYSQSRQMADDGVILCEHYLDYVADINAEKWTRSYHVDGREEIVAALFVKNTIPNVSGVVFRRDALLQTLQENHEEIVSFRNAGDWVTYLRLLEKGSIAFCPLALNSHRRHQSSVTIGNFNLRQLQEIVQVQRDTIRRFGIGGVAEMRAASYAQKLYEQFGLANDSYPLFSMHPELFVGAPQRQGSMS